MIKKYVSKFTIDILPSIIATIVGAYIVTHYINPKPDTDKPAAALATAPDSGIDSKAAVASPVERSRDLADAPAVVAPKAKVEKASIDKSNKPDASDAQRHPAGPPRKGRRESDARARRDCAGCNGERCAGRSDANP